MLAAALVAERLKTLGHQKIRKFWQFLEVQELYNLEQRLNIKIKIPSKVVQKY